MRTNHKLMHKYLVFWSYPGSISKTGKKILPSDQANASRANATSAFWTYFYYVLLSIWAWNFFKVIAVINIGPWWRDKIEAEWIERRRNNVNSTSCTRSTYINQVLFHSCTGFSTPFLLKIKYTGIYSYQVYDFLSQAKEYYVNIGLSLSYCSYLIVLIVKFYSLCYISHLRFSCLIMVAKWTCSLYKAPKCTQIAFWWYLYWNFVFIWALNLHEN